MKRNISYSLSVFSYPFSVVGSRYTVLGLLMSFFFISCEQTVNNPDLPYKEQLVVKAILKAGEKLDDVDITRTLHPLEEYDREEALVRDADVKILCDGTEYTLTFDGSDYYYSNELIPEIGKKYKLEVKWKDITVSSETTVPDTVTIESFTLKIVKNVYDDGWETWEEWSCIVRAKIKPLPTSVYSGYSYYSYPYKEYTGYAMVIKDTADDGMLYVPVLEHYFYNQWDLDTNMLKQEIRNYTCAVEVYDKPYYNYYLSRWEGDSGDDIFGTSGLNVKGNIKNGIGLFLGKSESKKRIEIE
jgi:hypothetical protein